MVSASYKMRLAIRCPPLYILWRIFLFGRSRMSKKRRLSNPLALAVLVVLSEQPMHPYEIAATLRARHKEESIKIRYGSLYKVIELLQKEGLIVAREKAREGRRPERTVYELTSSGRTEIARG